MLSFVDRQLPGDRIAGRRVLEVGALDVNGSVRSVIQPHGPALYLGIDIRHGPGVDIVLDVVEAPTRFGRESFDVVVCTEMLEHVELWRDALSAMKDVLRPGGTLVLTTRSPGFPVHDFPNDYWRFTCEDVAAALADLDSLVAESDPEAAGVFAAGVRAGRSVRRVDLGAISPQTVPGEKSMITGNGDGRSRTARRLQAVGSVVQELAIAEGRSRARQEIREAEATLWGFDERFRLPAESGPVKKAAFYVRQRRLARRVATHSATVEPWFQPDPAIAGPPPELAPGVEALGPTFVGIGASKSGTTWWYELLASHPRWCRRPHGLHAKELLYFDQFLARPFGPQDAARYRDHFRRPSDELLGEWTPVYWDSPWIAPLLAESVGDTPLLVMVRDPVERAVSDLRLQMTRYGHDFHTLDILEAARRSSYHQLLRPWLAIFPRRHVHLLQYERCVADPTGELARTWASLGVEDPCPPDRGALDREHVFHPATILVPDVVRDRLRSMLRSDASALAAEWPEAIDPGLWGTLTA